MLASLVAFLHSCVVLYIALIPVLAPWFFLPGHVGLCLLLILHWLTNNNTCAWTLLEAKLRGKPVERGFIYSIVRPVFESGRFKLGKSKGEEWCAIAIWISTLALLAISCYRLHESEEFSKAARRVGARCGYWAGQSS